MEFYYPNFTNDMWRIFGLCFFADKAHFVDEAAKSFRLDSIVSFLTQHKIGMYDTAQAVRRLRNTASDKDLQVVQPTNLGALLRRIPECTAIVVTGQKACDVLQQQLGIERQPAVGACVSFTFEQRAMRLWRMPSSSRAYPLRVEDKAAKYDALFEKEGMKAQHGATDCCETAKRHTEQ